jgi:hypothetical protein
MSQLSSTRDYLGWALTDCGLIELRHQDGGRWATGWFTDLDALLQEARARAGTGNLYLSLNAPKPRPVANSMTGSPIRDEDVAWITRLPFDLDPERPTGVCATDEELAAAFERRNALVAMLGKLGWPLPLHAKSGNGYHALYRVRLPNNAETREMLAHLYRGLAGQFGDNEVAFDTSVRNPGRILRLYGSINRKGPDTPERPHRESTCCIPPRWQQIPPRLIARLAEHYARQQTPRPAAAAAERPAGSPTPTGRGDYASLDVVAWFAAHGLYRGHIRDHLHAVTCPWSEEHSTPSPANGGDTVIFESDGGWPGFACKHRHCAERTIRDVMQTLGDADAFCAVAYRREEQA